MLTGGNAVVVAFVEALAGSVFVAAGLYWGVYLTNTKQRSLYRSTTVGLGFGLGAALLTYGFQLYYAIRINVGAFTGTDMAKASILSTSTASLYLDAVRNILVVLVYMALPFWLERITWKRRDLPHGLRQSLCMYLSGLPT